MSARSVWVLSNDISPDVPYGVIKVFRAKHAACAEAALVMREQGEPFTVRRYGHLVDYTDHLGEYRLRVQRFNVQEAAAKAPTT